MEIAYATSFLRLYKKMEPRLQQEVKEKIAIFKKDYKDPSLKTHKLKGRLKDRWSFSVNYSVRIVFRWGKLEKNNHKQNLAILLVVGDHSIYD